MFVLLQFIVFRLLSFDHRFVDGAVMLTRAEVVLVLVAVAGVATCMSTGKTSLQLAAV